MVLYGICGPDIDRDLVNFAAMFSQLGTHGIKVERYNGGQQPMAFVQNPADGNRLEVARPPARCDKGREQLGRASS